MTSARPLKDEPLAIQQLVQSAQECFHQTFEKSTHTTPFVCTVAPGRVNLIGEHTDYTGGFVFPMAIDYSTVCFGYGHVVEKSEDDNDDVVCEIVSVNIGPSSKLAFSTKTRPEPLQLTQYKWANYVIGVVAQYLDWMNPSSHKTVRFCLAIAGNVPLGSGLSSSASLEVSVATFLESILLEPTTSFSPKDRAIRCQKSEHEFCNTPCGIMDQYISSAACAGAALLIDCRSLEYQNVRMGQSNEDEEPVFVIINSHVTHSNSEGEYPIRVAQCKEATVALKSIYTSETIDSLRDVTWEQVNNAQNMLDPLIFKRAKHVVTENQRVLAAKKAMEEGHWLELGKWMNQSHESMKNDYETSCEEINILVDLAQHFEGVYGSRLTGGGFGGCTVSLVKKDALEKLCNYIQKEYKTRTGIDCTCFETQAGPGARVILL